MRKVYSSALRVATLALVAGMASGVTAQQLPNVGFENWKSAAGDSEAFGTGGSSASPVEGEMRQRPGVEPEGWNGSSVNQKVLLTVNKELVSKEERGEGNYAAKLFNEFVGMFGIGSNAPGFLTLGTPWVYASMTLDDCDGGVYGGVDFTATPDAIAGDFQRTDSNDEESHLIAYLWNGTFKSLVGNKNNPTEEREDVTNAVVGRADESLVSEKGNLVAMADLEFTTTDGEWKTLVAELDYSNGQGAPEKANVIVSSGSFWDRGNLQAGTTLLADNVRFVYYSRALDIVYGDDQHFDLSEVTFTDGQAEVTVDFTFDEVKGFTTKGLACTAPDLCNSTYATVREDGGVDYQAVFNNPQGEDIDGLSTHTYTIHFAAPAAESIDYPGYLTIVMAGDPLAENQEAVITITPTGNNECTFTLPDFQLDLGYGPQPLGDIVVPNVKMEPVADGVKYTGNVEGMQLLGGEIVADVTLEGTITDEGVVNMNIQVMWMNIPIDVTFTSSESGIVLQPNVDGNANVEYYNLNGVRVNAGNLNRGQIYIIRSGNKVEKTIL